MIARILPGEEPDTQEFEDGVVAGFHACGIDMALGHLPENDEQLEVTVDFASSASPGQHSEDYYAGWLGGYQARRDQ